MALDESQKSEVELLANPSVMWTLTVFRRSDAMAIDDEGYPTVWPKLKEPMPDICERVEGGWGHEHCELCQARISEDEGERDGWHDGAHDWICRGCFERTCGRG